MYRALERTFLQEILGMIMVTIFVNRKGNFYFYIYQRLQVTYTTFKISIVEVLGLLQMIRFHKKLV